MQNDEKKSFCYHSKLLSVNKAFVQLEENKETQEREDVKMKEEKQGFMYRYLHGCKVTKRCGMLQVADPRPAPEDLVLPARPLHSRPECFYHLKGRKTRTGQCRHHEATSGKLCPDWKVQPDVLI